MGYRHDSTRPRRERYYHTGTSCEDCYDEVKYDDGSDTGYGDCSNCYINEYAADLDAGLTDWVPGPIPDPKVSMVTHSTVTLGVPAPPRSKLSETFNFGSFNQWDIIEQIAGSNVDKLLLWGPPATGKSTLAQTMGLGGRKVYPVTLTEEAPAEVFTGHHIAAGDRFVWMDNAGTLAMRTDPITNMSGRLVINEIDKATGDAADMMYVFCDDPSVAQISLPKEDHEVLKPGFGYQVFGTTNANPNTLPDALRDRFPITIHVTEVNEGAIKRLPEDLQSAARASSQITDPARRISVRKWYAFASLREKFDAHIAAYAVFGKDGATMLAQIEMAS